MTRHANMRVPSYLTRDAAMELRDQEPGTLPDWLVRADRTPPLIEPWPCPSAQCAGMWTDRGSYALRRCTRCGTPRPRDEPRDEPRD